jgi:hypothetical protein
VRTLQQQILERRGMKDRLKSGVFGRLLVSTAWSVLLLLCGFSVMTYSEQRPTGRGGERVAESHRQLGNRAARSARPHCHAIAS